MWFAGAPVLHLPTPSPSLPLPSLLHPRGRVWCSSSVPVKSPGPVVKKRKRYRKSYPGESNGITQEMRFVAMRLRNAQEEEPDVTSGEEEATWQPSLEGYLRYLVDSRLVFDTIESIVDHSEDVSYAHFRKTGLERTQSLSKDIEHFGHLGVDIPEPSSPGTTYADYLKEIATTSAPLFLSHFYNIYFAHISGGQVVGEKVCKKLLEGKQLEFYKWEGDALQMLKDVREKLNDIGQHWSRDEKNKCLQETAKCFRLSGQIVRLIIL